MRASTRWWIWLSLAVVATGVLCFRIFWPRFAKPDTPGAITDLSVSNPLNQPGGGDVAAEAYEVYSALYRQPQQEPLAFAEESQTDIPQLNGSCLKPSTLLTNKATAGRKSSQFRTGICCSNDPSPQRPRTALETAERARLTANPINP